MDDEAEQYIAAVRAGQLSDTTACPRCQHPTVMRQLGGDPVPVLYDVTVTGVPAPRGVTGVHTMLAPHDKARCRECRGARPLPSRVGVMRVATLLLVLAAALFSAASLASSLVLPLIGVCP